jgi:hypothetical protein
MRSAAPRANWGMGLNEAFGAGLGTVLNGSVRAEFCADNVKVVMNSEKKAKLLIFMVRLRAMAESP